MVRRVMYIVLALIAFQLSWNVITGYCMHETGRASDHFGHHQHNVTSDELMAAAKVKPHQPKSDATHDTHCVSHAHLALGLPAPDVILAFMDNGGIPVIVKLVVPTSAFAIPPERPQWIDSV